MKFRKHYDYDVQKASDEVAIICPEESLTIQSMAEDADINVLMMRYGITGKMPDNPRVPMFGDFTEIVDYRSALEALMKAQDGFNELPAKVRARFENDPQQLMEFIADDRNIDEARSLGLLKEKVDVPTQQVASGGGESGAPKASPGSPGVAKSGA